jgi:hypothetical protein
VKYVIPTRDWVEFLKARLHDIIEEGMIPKEELRFSNSVCTHVVRHLLIMRLRDLMLWYEDELELNLVDRKDMLVSFELEVMEGLIARIFPNFASVVGVTEKPNPVLLKWGEIIELEVIEPLDSFLQDHLASSFSLEPSWQHATLKQMGNSYILNRGEDYRALFWDKYRNTIKP